MVFILMACTTAIQPDPPLYEIGHFPELSSVTTVNVGQVMLTEFEHLAQVQATLIDDLPSGRRSGSVSSGATLISAKFDGQQVFCRLSSREGSPCLTDTNGDGSFDKAYTLNTFGHLVSGRDIDSLRYRIRENTIQDGFKYELIYQGRQGDVVRIGYREYTDNLARPAYSQGLSYTLDESLTDIRFRNVSITIHEANNSEITYIVNSGF